MPVPVCSSIMGNCIMCLNQRCNETYGCMAYNIDGAGKISLTNFKKLNSQNFQ